MFLFLCEYQVEMGYTLVQDISVSESSLKSYDSCLIITALVHMLRWPGQLVLEGVSDF